jgi:hypothetical protein
MTVEGRAEDRSFLERTHQAWKLYVFSLLLLGSATAFVLMILALNSTGGLQWLPDNFTLAVGTSAGGLAAVAWLWLSLRCPECRKPIAPRIIQTENVSSWLTTLLTMTRCPNCRSGGEVKPL